MKQQTTTTTLAPISGIGTATTLVGSGSINGTLEVGQTVTAVWPTVSGQTPISSSANVVTDTGITIASGTLDTPPTIPPIDPSLVGRRLRLEAKARGYGTLISAVPSVVSSWTNMITQTNNQTVFIGALGDGGFRPYSYSGLAQPVATITKTDGSTASGWSVSAGWASYSGNLTDLNGQQLLVTPVDASPITVTLSVLANTYIVKSWAEFETRFAVGTALDGRTIMFRAGATEYTISSSTSWWDGKLKAWATTGLTICADRNDVLPPIVHGSWRFNALTTTSCGPLNIKGLWMHRPASLADQRPVNISDTVNINAISILAGTGSFKGLVIENNRIYSDFTTPAAQGGYCVADIAGISVGSRGVVEDDITIRNNEFEYLVTGVIIRSSNLLIKGNYLHNLFNDYFIVQGGDTIKIIGNEITDPMGWYGWLHQDMTHLQPNGTLNNLHIEGNLYSVGAWEDRMRGGGMTAGSTTVSYSGDLVLDRATHSGKTLVADAAAITGAVITLPDPTTMAEECIWISGKTVGLVAKTPVITCATPSTSITFPLTLSSSVQGGEFAFRSNGTQWEPLMPGLRPGHYPRSSITTVLPSDNTGLILMDITSGSKTLTYNADTLTNFQVGLLYPAPGKTLTIQPSSGVGPTIVIDDFKQTYIFSKSTSWSVLLAKPNAQGQFSNSFYRTSGWRGTNIRVVNNIIVTTNTTHGSSLSDDELGNIREYNTIISAPDSTGYWSSSFPIIRTDRVIDTVTPSNSAPEKNAYFTGRNIVAAQGGTSGTFYGNKILGLIDGTNSYADAQALYTSVFTGSTFRCRRRVDAVSALRPRSGYTNAGAVPASDGEPGRWNWTTMEYVPSTAEMQPSRVLPLQGELSAYASGLIILLEMDNAFIINDANQIQVKDMATDTAVPVTVTAFTGRLEITINTTLTNGVAYYVTLGSTALKHWRDNRYNRPITKGDWVFTANTGAFPNKLSFYDGSGNALATWGTEQSNTLTSEQRFDTAANISAYLPSAGQPVTFLVDVMKDSVAGRRCSVRLFWNSAIVATAAWDTNTGVMTATPSGWGTTYGRTELSDRWRVWFKATGAATRYYWSLHNLTNAVGSVTYVNPILVPADNTNPTAMGQIGNWTTPTTLKSSVTIDGVTFNFANPVPVGSFVNGDTFVLSTNNVELTSTSVPSTIINADTYYGNGLMVNPYIDGARVQGWDGYLGTGESPVAAAHTDYSASLNKDPGATGSSLIATAGSEVSWVKAVRKSGALQNDWQINAKYPTLHVLPSVPYFDAFPPAPSSTTKTLRRASDINWGVFRSLTMPAGFPTLAEIEAKLPSDFGIFGAFGYNYATGECLRRFRLDQALPDGSNYSAHISDNYSRACLVMHDNRYTQAEKTPLLYKIIKWGLQIDALYIRSGAASDFLLNGAGQGGAWYPLWVTTAFVLRDAAMLSRAMAASTQIDQVYWVDQTRIDTTTPEGSSINLPQAWLQEMLGFALISPTGNDSSFDSRYGVIGGKNALWDTLGFLFLQNGPNGETGYSARLAGGADNNTNTRAAIFGWVDRTKAISDKSWPMDAYNPYDGIAIYDLFMSLGMRTKWLGRPDQPHLGTNLTHDGTAGDFFTGGNGSISWDYSSKGEYSTQPITQRDMRYSLDGKQWVTVPNVSASGSVTGLLKGLAHYCGYRIQNASGSGPWSQNYKKFTSDTSDRNIVVTTGTDSNSAPANIVVPELLVQAYPLWGDYPGNYKTAPSMLTNPVTTLTIGAGYWSGYPAPVLTDIQWQRNDGGGWVNISGATNVNYTTDADADANCQIRAGILPNNGIGSPVRVYSSAVSVPDMAFRIVSGNDAAVFSGTSGSSTIQIGTASDDRWVYLLTCGTKYDGQITSLNLNGTYTFTLIQDLPSSVKFDWSLQVWRSVTKVPASVGTSATINLFASGTYGVYPTHIMVIRGTSSGTPSVINFTSSSTYPAAAAATDTLSVEALSGDFIVGFGAENSISGGGRLVLSGLTENHQYYYNGGDYGTIGGNLITSAQTKTISFTTNYNSFRKYAAFGLRVS